jgi:ABC-type dipeptide/oligopeptide/nickel transport system permease subunit
MPGRRSIWSLRALTGNPVALVCGIYLVAIGLAAIFAGLVAPHDPYATSVLDRLHGPSSGHLVGTDQVGRDLLSRMIYGARPSLAIAGTSVLVSALLGTIIGLLTGYFGGAVDLVLQRGMDAIQVFPGLIAAMLVIAALGRGDAKIVIPLIIIFTPGTARVVRASTLAVRRSDYVAAVEATGAPVWRILFVHILPNILAPILVISSSVLGYAILVEASLSFLGLGVQAPSPSWGGILAQEGRAQMAQHPYLVVVPSVAISLTVLAVNILGDTIRDALDPALRRRA